MLGSVSIDRITGLDEGNAEGVAKKQFSAFSNQYSVGKQLRSGELLHIIVVKGK